jgi:hypothetical protein
MEKLGEQQKQELATALAILALYDGEVRLWYSSVRVIVRRVCCEILKRVQ